MEKFQNNSAECFQKELIPNFLFRMRVLGGNLIFLEKLEKAFLHQQELEVFTDKSIGYSIALVSDFLFHYVPHAPSNCPLIRECLSFIKIAREIRDKDIGKNIPIAPLRSRQAGVRQKVEKTLRTAA